VPPSISEPVIDSVPVTDTVPELVSVAPLAIELVPVVVHCAPLSTWMLPKPAKLLPSPLIVPALADEASLSTLPVPAAVATPVNTRRGTA
jgi:hypothetical protein